MSSGTDQLEAGVKAFGGLLGEFRAGRTADKDSERHALECHLRELSAGWDRRFPGFPQEKYPYASLRGVSRRGRRDEYLKRIIVSLLEGEASDSESKTIVNPACVFGRHARDLASRLERITVIATDIEPAFNWFYEHIPGITTPGNYEFRRDNIFNPKLQATPTAVVFFGACGSVSDGAIDYAIDANCPHLICRTCCHDNIGGNTTITKRFNVLNWAFRIKNFAYAGRRKKAKGDYFSPKYSKDHYPASRTARGLSNSDEFVQISQNSVDSDICRTIIDLDRFLRLVENRYNVWYKGELFAAQKNN